MLNGFLVVQEIGSIAVEESAISVEKGKVSFDLFILAHEKRNILSYQLILNAERGKIAFDLLIVAQK